MMLKNGVNYVAIYRDDREANPYRINPAICGLNPGDSVIYANHLDSEVVLKFPQWPFETGSSPMTLNPGTSVTLTVGSKAGPGDVFPYAAKCQNGQIDAEGSRPIIIIYR